MALDLLDGKPMPASVTIQPAKLAAAVYIAEDKPGIWKWPIFPKGFRAPALTALARRQALRSNRRSWERSSLLLNP